MLENMRKEWMEKHVERKMGKLSISLHLKYDRQMLLLALWIYTCLACSPQMQMILRET